MSAWNGETHPAASIAPMLDDEALLRLAVNIARDGLEHPIVLTPSGELLDGRNRFKACEMVGVEPTFTTFDGDPWAFVERENEQRRNLTTGQQVAIRALSLLAQGKRQDNGRWERGSIGVGPDDGDTGKSSDTPWVRAMSQAGVISDWAGDKLSEVRDGSLSLDAAYRFADAQRQAEQFRIEQEAKAKLRELKDSEVAFDAFLTALVNVAKSDFSRIEKFMPDASNKQLEQLDKYLKQARAAQDRVERMTSDNAS